MDIENLKISDFEQIIREEKLDELLLKFQINNVDVFPLFFRWRVKRIANHLKKEFKESRKIDFDVLRGFYHLVIKRQVSHSDKSSDIDEELIGFLHKRRIPNWYYNFRYNRINFSQISRLNNRELMEIGFNEDKINFLKKDTSFEWSNREINQLWKNSLQQVVLYLLLSIGYLIMFFMLRGFVESPLTYLILPKLIIPILIIFHHVMFFHGFFTGNTSEIIEGSSGIHNLSFYAFIMPFAYLLATIAFYEFIKFDHSNVCLYSGLEFYFSPYLSKIIGWGAIGNLILDLFLFVFGVYTLIQFIKKTSNVVEDSEEDKIADGLFTQYYLNNYRTILTLKGMQRKIDQEESDKKKFRIPFLPKFIAAITFLAALFGVLSDGFSTINIFGLDISSSHPLEVMEVKPIGFDSISVKLYNKSDELVYINKATIHFINSSYLNKVDSFRIWLPVPDTIKNQSNEDLETKDKIIRFYDFSVNHDDTLPILHKSIGSAISSEDTLNVIFRVDNMNSYDEIVLEDRISGRIIRYDLEIVYNQFNNIMINNVFQLTSSISPSRRKDFGEYEILLNQIKRGIVDERIVRLRDN